MPFVNPLTTYSVCDEVAGVKSVQLDPSDDRLIWYPVIDWPPRFDGVAQESVRVPDPVGVARKFVAADAGFNTVPCAGVPNAPVPTSVTAATLNVYVVPALKPVIKAEVTVASAPFMAGV